MFLLQRASEKSLIIKRIEIKALRFGGLWIFNPRKNIGIVDIVYRLCRFYYTKKTPDTVGDSKKALAVPYENKTPFDLIEVRSGNSSGLIFPFSSVVI